MPEAAISAMAERALPIGWPVENDADSRYASLPAVWDLRTGTRSSTSRVCSWRGTESSPRRARAWACAQASSTRFSARQGAARRRPPEGRIQETGKPHDQGEPLDFFGFKGDLHRHIAAGESFQTTDPVTARRWGAA